MIRDCPDSWENLKKNEKVNETEEVKITEVVLFTGSDKQNMKVLGRESSNKAVFDSACSSTVAGRAWFEVYLDKLQPDFRKHVKYSTGIKKFRFGAGEILKSLFEVEFPAIIVGKQVTIKSSVVESSIPLLL